MTDGGVETKRKSINKKLYYFYTDWYIDTKFYADTIVEKCKTAKITHQMVWMAPCRDEVLDNLRGLSAYTNSTLLEVI